MLEKVEIEELCGGAFGIPNAASLKVLGGLRNPSDGTVVVHSLSATVTESGSGALAAALPLFKVFEFTGPGGEVTNELRPGNSTLRLEAPLELSGAPEVGRIFSAIMNKRSVTMDIEGSLGLSLAGIRIPFPVPFGPLEFGCKPPLVRTPDSMIAPS